VEDIKEEMDIIDKLDILMELKEKSREDIANYTKVPLSTVHNWWSSKKTNHKVVLKAPVVNDLSKLFDVPLKFLCDDHYTDFSQILKNDFSFSYEIEKGKIITQKDFKLEELLELKKYIKFLMFKRSK